MSVTTPIKKPVYAYDPKVAAIHRLRVNVKSLAAEAKIIRQEAWRCGMAYEYSLTLHRKGRLREEARYAHLALAYFRGRSYKSVEAKAKTMDADKLMDKIHRAGFQGGRTEALKATVKWLET